MVFIYLQLNTDIYEITTIYTDTIKERALNFYVNLLQTNAGFSLCYFASRNVII